MGPGDEVVVLEDPLNLLVGVIQWVEPDGRLMVEFAPSESAEWMPPHREVFSPHEIELVSVWMRAA